MAGVPVFRAAMADAALEPVTFRVDGDPEPFHVQRPVPGMPVLELAVEAVSDDGTDHGRLAAFVRYLQAVLGPEWPRFRDASTLARLGVDDLLGIVQYITEQATGRPTTPPSAAASSSRSSGRPSRAKP